MHDDDHPEDVLYRKKTCPACRTVVKSRPIPLFLIKSIANAIHKAKGDSESSPRSSPTPDGDPWLGIFLEHSDSDHDEDMYDPDDYGPDYGDYEIEDMGSFTDYGDYGSNDEWPFDYGYGSDEDATDYDGNYVPARWEPPAHEVDPDDYPFELGDEVLRMLRRGATPAMIDIFTLSYSHEMGLRAVLSGNIVYLGWNIDLHPGDASGEEFMEWVRADIYNRPERWDREEIGDGLWTAWRLVREDEREEEGDYATTDSEAYEPYEDASDGGYGDGGYDYYGFDD